MATVRIGPSFFANEFNEYADWHHAFIREALQNGIDARGSSLVEFEIVLAGDDTLVTFTNDGRPMDRDILVNKLLALGESGKRFEDGAVGGFGKAKNLLYFCHKSYTVDTGNLHVVGCGGEYEINDSPFFGGTRSAVLIAGDHVEELCEAFKWFAALGQWSGTLKLNGEEFQASLAKGSPRRTLDFGTVYTNKSYSNRLVVRINGIPMYSTDVSLNRCVIVELNGKSSEVLTSNRDGLRYPYSSQLMSFVAELAVDKKKALKPKRVSKYQIFRGAKLQSQVERPTTLTSIIGEIPNYVVGRVEEEEVAPVRTIGLRAESRVSDSWDREEVSVESRCSLNNYFVLKNDTDMFIPNCYNPNSHEFGQYSKRLATYWAKLMLQCHKLFECSNEFGVGFLFSEDDEAQRERTSEYGIVYYLNPVEIRTQINSRSRSFAKRFALTERGRLISLAVHEMCHEWCKEHDVDFAYKFTDMFAKTLDWRSDFNWCFR